jgi:hypothetical protein
VHTSTSAQAEFTHPRDKHTAAHIVTNARTVGLRCLSTCGRRDDAESNGCSEQATVSAGALSRCGNEMNDLKPAYVLPLLGRCAPAIHGARKGARTYDIVAYVLEAVGS